MSNDSLEHWIGRWNAGDEDAIERVLLALEPALRVAIRRRIDPRLRSKFDSVDIVQSVYADVVAGLRKGAWHFETRGQVLAFLRRLAWRRLADRYQEHRHGIGREHSLDETAPRDQPVSMLPRPSQVAQGRELWDRVLGACPPEHREIVRLRRAGLRLTEIADRTGLHEGSVRRILYELARRLSISRRTSPAAGPDPA